MRKVALAGLILDLVSDSFTKLVCRNKLKVRRLNLGILRLKKEKDTNARRILMRNSINGKILIVCLYIMAIFC